MVTKQGGKTKIMYTVWVNINYDMGVVSTGALRAGLQWGKFFLSSVFLLKRTRGLLLKEKIPVWNFCFWHFPNDFASGLVSGELLVSPLVPSLSLFVLSFSFSFPFLSFFVSLSGHCCCGLLLASSMAESSHCFQNYSRNSVHRLVLVTDLYPL